MVRENSGQGVGVEPVKGSNGMDSDVRVPGELITKLSYDAKYEAYIELAKKAEKFTDLPIPDENPFTYKLSTRMRMQKVVKGAVNNFGFVDIIDKDTGEVVSGVTENRLFVKKQMVDNDTFVKLYNNRLKQVFGLTHSAIKVFGYFLHVMQMSDSIGKDMVFFNFKECMDFCGYRTHPMVYNGLRELVINGFIARSPRAHHFFIDPAVAFNGSRLLVMEEYINKDSAEYFDGAIEDTEHEEVFEE